jgi:S-DNA-T family DNA segregation ATPase FtsK/SpoIIIE
MFVECLTVGGLLGLIDLARKAGSGDTELLEVKHRWDLAMIGAGIKNKGGLEESPELLKIIKKQYGYDCIVSIPNGFSHEEFDKHKEVIKTNMRCVDINMEWVKTGGSMYMRLITIPIDDSKYYEPVQTAPHEMYVGTTQYYKDIISSMGIYPHILVSGATGTGKSVFLFMLLLHILANHDENTANIYLAQISDKKDLRLFQDAKQVKYYADNFGNATKMYAYIVAEMVKRNNLINKYYDVNNIGEYNKKFPKASFPYIYVFADEFSFYAESARDDDETTFYKTACNDFIDRIVKQGRSAGIFLVVGLQRPDKVK